MEIGYDNLDFRLSVQIVTSNYWELVQLQAQNYAYTTTFFSPEMLKVQQYLEINNIFKKSLRNIQKKRLTCINLKF